MSYTKPNRRWGTVIFWLGIVVFGAIVTPWRQLVQGQDGSSTVTPELTAGAVPTTTLGPDTVIINIYSSDTKEDWLNLVTERFNSAQIKIGDGRTIFVQHDPVDSGGSKDDILDGKIQPVVWSPGDRSWVYSLNQEWKDRTGRPLIPEDCAATVYSPVGFAMFRNMAEVMGWPDKPIGWDEILALAADPEGWARYDRPEWGAFKFGHTQPVHSNSGLLLLAALAYSVSDVTDGLTVEHVKDPAFMDALRLVESHTEHYGRRSRENTYRMSIYGQGFLHATNASEAETLRTNSGLYGEPIEPLVFILPAGGTFWPDHPYCVLDADWVTPEQREAARLYGDYLLAPEQQALAYANYVRPIDPSLPPSGPFTLENGTDPSITIDSVPALDSPAPDVTGAIQDAWVELKKKATIAILLDTSGSMAGDKLEDAKAAIISSLNSPDRLYKDDWLAIMQFKDQPMELQPAGRVGDVVETLTGVVDRLYASDGTALFDAVCEAAIRLRARQADDLAAGEQRLYGIVVLSDGDDRSSKRSENDMFNCVSSDEETQGIRVFTIAYGDTANKDVLLRLANRTNGAFYPASPDTIQKILLEILVQ